MPVISAHQRNDNNDYFSNTIMLYFVFTDDFMISDLFIAIINVYKLYLFIDVNRYLF